MQCDCAIHAGEQYRLYVYAVEHPKYGSRLENQYVHEVPDCPIYREAAE